MEKIAIWSLFRDDDDAYIDRYLERINSLDYPSENLRFYLAEGDSVDGTYERLVKKIRDDKRITVVKYDTGMPDYGSTVRPERFKALCGPGNSAIDEVVIDGWADIGLTIESDILYDPDLVRRLLEDRPEENCVISPMVWILFPSGEWRFYDIWAFRHEQDAMFMQQTQDWYKEKYGTGLLEVWATGSVVMLPMEALVNGARYTEKFPEAIMGIVRHAAGQGCKVYCDLDIPVIHPSVWGD